MSEKSALYDELVSCLTPTLTSFGFSKYFKGLHEFIRPQKGYDQRIGLDLYKRGESWLLSLRLKVRFEDVERLRIVHGRPNADATTRRHASTAVKLIENLAEPTKDLSPIPIADLSALQGAIPEVERRITSVALPFFDRYSEFGALLEHAQSDRGDWPMPSLEQRAEVIVIGLALRHDTQALEKWVPALRSQIGAARGSQVLRSFDGFLKSMATEFEEVPVNR